MLSNYARWPEPNAGWRDGMCVEAYLALDFFRSFCIKAKRTKEKIRCACLTSGGNTFEVLVSFGEPNELIL
jgi:hypothetical protein